MLTIKYQPKTTNELLINKNVLKVINTSNNILLYGPAGTGKTTIINTLINDLQGRYLLINVSENRGINLIRDDIMNFIGIDINNKVIILDEMDSLTIEAQNTLNNLMDISNTKFIFVCNYINNVGLGILSKCCCIRIGNIDKNLLRDRIRIIVLKEKIYISDKSIDYVIDYYGNDIRKILNCLESVKNIYGNHKIILFKEIKEVIN